MSNVFTAPTSYAEVKAMLGHTYTLPNGVEGRVSGCGSSEVIGSLAFVAPDSKGHEWIAFWTGERGFETAADRKVREWDDSAKKMPKTARALVDTVFPGVFEREDRATLKDPAKLVNVAKVRLHKAGVLEYDNCSRCGGSGHYSRCEMYGTTCFKCAGKGKQFPNDSTALKAARTLPRCDAA